MKYGNFVSETNMELSENDIKYFVKYFMDMVTKYDLPIKLINHESDRSNNSYKIYFESNTEIAGRNLLKDRVISFNGITIIIHKANGYLDATDWGNGFNGFVKDYENAPEYQFNVNIDIDGMIKPYRKRNEEKMSIVNTYQYGTEYSDFDYNKSFDILRDCLIVD